MTFIISLLISLALITSPAEFEQLDNDEQQELMGIVIVDDIDM